jgi:hypothetical protein
MGSLFVKRTIATGSKSAWAKAATPVQAHKRKTNKERFMLFLPHYNKENIPPSGYYKILMDKILYKQKSQKYSDIINLQAPP